MPAIHELIRAPEFRPGVWVNSPPLTLADLRGRVILVDFWDFSSLNCLRTLPYVQTWWHRYRERGFEVIGIHSPEFEFARDVEQVAQEVRRLGIAYPVLIDSEQTNWLAWANRYWPTKYLLDQDGYIRFFHYGEGEYLTLEANIQVLIRQRCPAASLPGLMVPLRGTDEPGAICEHASPVLYLGATRGHLGNREPSRLYLVVFYADPGEHQPDTPYLEGAWQQTPEAVSLATGDGTVSVRYRGAQVYAVFSPPRGQEGLVVVTQDGRPLAGDVRGADVRVDGEATVVRVATPRLYELVANQPFGVHDLCLHVVTPGVAVYVINFVTACRVTDEEVEDAA